MTEAEIKVLVKKEIPEATIEKVVPYKDLFLVRIGLGDVDESGYDPFLSVDPMTGAVEEFSILTDGDPIEIAKAFGV